MLYTIYNIENKEVLYCQNFDTEPTLAHPLKATSKLNTKSFNKEMFDGENFYEGSPFPIEKYSKEINDYHNQMLDQVLKEKNYLSLGEVALWLNDVNYGAEAQGIIDWYKSSYQFISAHIANVTEYQDPTEFLLTIPKL